MWTEPNSDSIDIILVCLLLDLTHVRISWFAPGVVQTEHFAFLPSNDDGAAGNEGVWLSWLSAFLRVCKRRCDFLSGNCSTRLLNKLHHIQNHIDPCFRLFSLRIFRTGQSWCQSGHFGPVLNICQLWPSTWVWSGVCPAGCCWDFIISMCTWAFTFSGMLLHQQWLVTIMTTVLNIHMLGLVHRWLAFSTGNICDIVISYLLHRELSSC